MRPDVTMNKHAAPPPRSRSHNGNCLGALTRTSAADHKAVPAANGGTLALGPAAVPGRYHKADGIDRPEARLSCRRADQRSSNPERGAHKQAQSRNSVGGSSRTRAHGFVPISPTCRLVSGWLAKVRGGDSNRSLTSESRAARRAGGKRPATVQQVVAERYEQSGLLGASAAEDLMVVAQAPSRVAASRQVRNGVSRLCMKAPSDQLSPIVRCPEDRDGARVENKPARGGPVLRPPRNRMLQSCDGLGEAHAARAGQRAAQQGRVRRQRDAAGAEHVAAQGGAGADRRRP
jgi:hypothetical protein